VEFTDEFGHWYEALDARVQDDIDRVVGLLEARGPNLPHPYSSGISGARRRHLRELRVQSAGRAYRIFYAFDPRRVAILLIGGVKGGDKRFYEVMVAQAERLYEAYLEELRREGLLE
jgi:hypothetical protein